VFGWTGWLIAVKVGTTRSNGAPTAPSPARPWRFDFLRGLRGLRYPIVGQRVTSGFLSMICVYLCVLAVGSGIGNRAGDITNRKSRATRQFGRKRNIVRVFAACRGFVSPRWRSVLRGRNNACFARLESRLEPVLPARSVSSCTPGFGPPFRPPTCARLESRLQPVFCASRWSPGSSRFYPPEGCNPTRSLGGWLATRSARSRSWGPCLRVARRTGIDAPS
jgi:hypothetical protein